MTSLSDMTEQVICPQTDKAVKMISAELPNYTMIHHCN